MNYGSLDDVKKLFALIGIKESAAIFFKNSQRIEITIFQKLKTSLPCILKSMHKEILTVSQVEFIGTEISDDEVKKFLTDVAITEL